MEKIARIGVSRIPEEGRFLFKLCSPKGIVEKKLGYSESVIELRRLKSDGWQVRYDE